MFRNLRSAGINLPARVVVPGALTRCTSRSMEPAAESRPSGLKLTCPPSRKQYHRERDAHSDEKCANRQAPGFRQESVRQESAEDETRRDARNKDADAKQRPHQIVLSLTCAWRIRSQAAIGV